MSGVTVSSQRARQDRLEVAIAEQLARHLATLGIVLTSLEKGDEAALEPDVRGLVGGKRHGVEVVDAWYSEADAAGAWGLVRKLEEKGERGRAAGAGFSAEDLAHSSGDPFVARLQLALTDHGVRHYGIPTWLVLNASGVRAPLHTTSAGPRLVRELVKPARFAYLDAFLCMWDGGSAPHFFFPVP